MFLLTFCVLWAMVGHAQNNKLSEQDTSFKDYKKVMIIPFEDQMYLCGIQRQIAETSKKSHQEIVRLFRYGLASQLQNKFLYSYSTASLIHFRDTTQDLLQTYASIAYQFEPYQKELTPEEAAAEKKKKRKLKFKKKKEPTKLNGQLVSKKSTQPKFASLQIKKKEILTYLYKKYRTDLFVFITELDIQNDISNQVSLAQNTYKRDLRAHYAVVDSEGKFLSKGIVSTKFPNSVNSVSVITSVYFPKIADKLLLKLPKKIQLIQDQTDPKEKIKPKGM